MKHLDHLRRALMLEPRGHADMYGALLTEPVTPGAHAGVLFMHNEGWSTMCGHGVIAVATIAVERGLMWDAARRARTPATSRSCSTRRPARCAPWPGRRTNEGRTHVAEVSFRNVPSFVLAAGVPLQLGRPHLHRRRGVWRRLLRHRRCRGGRPVDGRRQAGGAEARRDGDRPRGGAAGEGRASRRARTDRDLRHDLHGSPPQRRGRPPAQRHGVRRCRGRSLAVRHAAPPR